uniref:Uncharacterized protein n=1 Tax=Anguilla anguilla TaxID=7936 RepID=A0A0E9P631_ANGAN
MQSIQTLHGSRTDTEYDSFPFPRTGLATRDSCSTLHFIN